MFEFHGWAVLLSSDREAALSPASFDTVLTAVREAQDGFSLLDVAQGGNGLSVLRLHGLRNHCRENALTLFQQVAVALPCSYGVLYIHDPEHPTHGEVFRVFRMAHGCVNEFPDQILSPRIPTIEAPYDSTRGT